MPNSPRPAGLPRRISRKWWTWLKRPAHFHVAKPRAFWVWRSWRLGLGLPKRSITMYDSVNVSEIPANAKAVAGYVGGRWRTFPVLVKNYPAAHKLSIAVSADEDADCLDVEKGDATPDQAPAWVRRQHARKIVPVVYTSAAFVSGLVAILAKADLKHGRDYKLWSAHYTGKPHRCSPAGKCGFKLPVEADATQYTDKALGRNLDASLCAPDFFA